MSYRQYNRGFRASGTGNVDVTLTNCQAGSYLAVLVIGDVDQAVTLTTQAGSTGAWTAPANLAVWNATDFYGQDGYYAQVSATGDVTVRAAAGTSSYLAMAVVEVDEIDSFDLADYVRDTTGGTNSVLGPSLTPTNNPAIRIAFAVDYGSTTDAPTVGTGLTNIGTWADLSGVEVARIGYERTSGTPTAGQDTFSDTAAGPWHVAVFIFREVAATADQEGARFGLDDGSESAHTFSQAQDADESTGLSVARLIRMLINGTGDLASTTYTLRYQKNGAGGYAVVPIGANTAPTLSWGAAGTIAYSASGGTSVAPTYPSGITTNSMLVLIVGQKPSTANSGTVTTPSGWTLRGSLTGAGGYGATLAADTGNTNLFVYTKDTITGSESGTLTVTVGTNNVCWANIYRVQASDRCTWSFEVATGSDTSAGSVSIATGSMAIAAGDHVIGAMCIPTDVTTPSQFSAHALAQTGTTFGTVNEVQEPDSTTGNDIGGYVIQAGVSSGSGSGAVTMSATAGGTTTNVRGPGLVIRLRAASVANEIYVAPSSNIAAGGEATTARLTAPAGKSTADFVTGRRWDDENGSDATDVTTDDYTEVEWSLAVQSPAVAGDYYDLRVYAGATALASYTVTPRWSIAGTDPFPLPHRPITGAQLNALLRM